MGMQKPFSLVQDHPYERALAWTKEHPGFRRKDLEEFMGWTPGAAQGFLNRKGIKLRNGRTKKSGEAPGPSTLAVAFKPRASVSRRGGPALPEESPPEPAPAPALDAKEVMPNSVHRMQSAAGAAPPHKTRPSRELVLRAIGWAKKTVEAPKSEPAPVPALDAKEVMLGEQSHPEIRPSRELVLRATGWAMGALAMAINAQTGWRFGTTPIDAGIFAGLSVLVDSWALVLPTKAVCLWRARRRVLSASAWVTWAAVTTMAVLATLAFASLNVEDTAAGRAAKVATATALAEKRTMAIDAARAAVQAITVARQAECQKRGPRCRDLEQREQDRMTELTAATAVPVPAEPAIGEPDPQVSGVVRLATWVGVELTSTDIGNLRLALIGVLPNLAGLVLAFGCALRRPAH